MGKQVYFYMHNVSIYVAFIAPNICLHLWTACSVLNFIQLSFNTLSKTSGTDSLNSNVKCLKYGLKLLNLWLLHHLYKLSFTVSLRRKDNFSWIGLSKHFIMQNIIFSIKLSNQKGSSGYHIVNCPWSTSVLVINQGLSIFWIRIYT